MIWRQQFKILFVLHLRKNILLVKGAKVSFVSGYSESSSLFYFLVLQFVVVILILCGNIIGR